MRDPSSGHRVSIRIVACLLFLASQAHADVIRSRTLAVNGRTVQEIRMGNEPGSERLVRLVVVTNGASPNTTSLLTAVADIDTWVDPARPAPPFTTVIDSGQVFSVGGGCRRGNQVDFPFINANQPRVLRISGGSSTVVPVSVAGEQWDSADCAATSDLTRTMFVFTNRTQQRGFLFVDTGQANDLLAPQVSLGQVKTPFVGGLRPSISHIPSALRKVALVFMQPDGQVRWWQYDPDAINVDFNCVAGAQSPPPTGFTIPRGTKVMDRDAIVDLNGDGQFEVVRMTRTTPPSCVATPVPTPAGPVAGSAFNWSEPGVALDPETGQLNFLAGTFTSVLDNGVITSHPGNPGGGSHAACAVTSSERINQILAAHPAPSPFEIAMVQRQLNEAAEQQASRVILKGGFETTDELVRAFCVWVGYMP